MKPRFVYILTVMNSKTGEQVQIFFKNQITKKKALLSFASDRWYDEEQDVLHPVIAAVVGMKEKDLQLNGILMSRTFYFKEVSRHITVQKEPLW